MSEQINELKQENKELREMILELAQIYKERSPSKGPIIKFIAKHTMTELPLATKCGMYLCEQCNNTNADTMTMTLENVDVDGVNIGSYEITVKKHKS